MKMSEASLPRLGNGIWARPLNLSARLKDNFNFFSTFFSAGFRIAKSGRRLGYPSRPPTPPYMRVRIRRFLKNKTGCIGAATWGFTRLRKLQPAAFTSMPSIQGLDFEDHGLLVRHSRRLCGSCSSGQRFAFGFLQIPPRGGHPCRSADDSSCQARGGLTCTPKWVRPAGRTMKSPA